MTMDRTETNEINLDAAVSRGCEKRWSAILLILSARFWAHFEAMPTPCPQVWRTTRQVICFAPKGAGAPVRPPLLCATRAARRRPPQRSWSGQQCRTLPPTIILLRHWAAALLWQYRTIADKQPRDQQPRFRPGTSPCLELATGKPPGRPNMRRGSGGKPLLEDVCLDLCV